MPDSSIQTAASKDQVEAAFSTALDDIRAALHKLAETLEQNHYRYDMDVPMKSAHDLLNDFEPYVRAMDALDSWEGA